MVKGIAFGAVAVILLGIAAWLGVAYSGIYNVAASDIHVDPVRWTFQTTMHRSIARRAADAEVPESLSDDLIREGATHYASSCVHCHGAPGREPSVWSRGMRPQPPHLAEAATEWKPKEIRWIVENGIKMTGMPAFGPHHDAEEILAITAFVVQLPGLSADDYRAMTEADEGQGDAAGTGDQQAPLDDPAIESN